MPDARILIVEDEGVAAMHIRRVVEGLGYAVLGVVPTGEEAVEKADELLPDLILIDIVLQGRIDGVQAAEQIRNRLDLAVVYLTASSDSATLKRAKVTEPFGYIIKPFDEKVLHTTIELALYRHEMESKQKERAEEVEALYAVSRILAQPWSFEQKCKGVLAGLAQVATADMTLMRVKEGDVMRVVAQAGKATWKRPETLPAEGTITGSAFSKRETIVANDYPSHPLAEPTAVSQGIKSLVATPIKADRWTLGVINLASREANHFPPKLVNLLSGIADGLAAL